MRGFCSVLGTSKRLSVTIRPRFLPVFKCSDRSITSEFVKVEPLMCNGETHSHCRVLTLNHNQSRNCLSQPMIHAIIEGLRECGESADCRSVVLSANAEATVWSSGHDLKQMHSLVTAAIDNDSGLFDFDLICDDWKRIFEELSELLVALRSQRQPVIAALHGLVTAASLQMACASDLVLCTADCRLSVPGLALALNASRPTADLVSQSMGQIGMRTAMQLLLSAKPITAETAFEKGLVNAVAADNSELTQLVCNYASDIAKQPREFTEQCKLQFYAQSAK